MQQYKQAGIMLGDDDLALVQEVAALLGSSRSYAVREMLAYYRMHALDALAARKNQSADAHTRMPHAPK